MHVTWPRRMLVAACCAALGLTACKDDQPQPLPDAAVDSKAPPVDGTGGSEGLVDDGGAADGLTDSLAPDTKPKPLAKWTKAADMTQARSWHTATVLDDGTVLVAGGLDSYKGVQSAERFDPKTGKWTSAGQMSEPHWHHTAELLDDGRVLIIGGCSGGRSNVCMNGVGADLFDPKAAAGSRWKKASPMLASRRSHCSTKLKDGRIFIAGGFDSSKNHTGIELYDPKTGSWSSPFAKLPGPQNLATCTTLATGKVLIVGGYSGTAPIGSVAIYDPTAGTLAVQSAKLKEPRYHHTATLLPGSGGRVLLVGGQCSSPTDKYCAVSDAEIYDPVTNKVVAGGSPGTATYYHRAVLLKSGAVLVTGGRLSPTQKKAMLFVPSPGSWSATVSMQTGRDMHAAALLKDGRVIVTGGEPNGTSDYGQTSVEIYTP